MSFFECCERLDESKYLHLCACPSATFDCESSEQDAELCGFSEFTDEPGIVASVPPKKYRTKVSSEDHNSITTCSEACSAPQTIVSGIPSRTRSFDADCNFDDGVGGLFQTDFYSCILSPCSSSLSFSQNTFTGLNGNAQEVATSTTSKGFDSGSIVYLTTLSVEDTETDALNRATPSAGTSCSSIYETRSTGFSFTKRTSGYTIACVDLVIGYEYEVTPAIRKRTAVIGSFGAWEDVAVTPVVFTATATTETIDDGGDPIDLDNIQGFEYEITSVNIEKTA